MNDLRILIEVKCKCIDFDVAMKSPSDFYRKLSNGKMSLGGPNQTNRRWWYRSVKGGSYSYRRSEEGVEILFDVELKSENLLGVKLQFLSRIKKMLPFSKVRIGGVELMENHLERFVANEECCFKGVQLIGDKYKITSTRP
jgi:hypothetical protein